jgi:pSer/pThr/pTyr-binding forkhead associated (FHA) protein
MYKLVIQDDEGKTTVVPLIRDELTIGRKEGNTIRLTERNVSRRHARLIRQNGSITIEDLNSYNGIRVNGSRISGRCAIREADRVQIGDYLIEVKSEAQDKVDTLNERTVPLERIDPHAHTPVPESPTQPIDTAAIATTRMTKDPAAPQVQFTTSPTEPMAAVVPPDDAVVSQPLSSATPVPPAPALAAQGNARLVVLSTNFAGREFELDKPAMVIGRTEENDICVNHRSISRHHAKIVRENGRYAIVDLQSSNGVRVNGEEYGKVELRRADVVDLGHVRLRFIEPGEDFLFGRDAQAVDVVPQGGPRLALWITVGLVVTGAIVALFLMLTRDEKPADAESTPAPVASDTPPQAKQPALPVVLADAAPQVAPVPVDDELGKELAAARDAIGREKWIEAQAAARRALMKDAASTEASDLFEQAKAEAAAEKTYKAFARAAGARSFAEVARQFKALHADSVYRVKAQPDHDRLKGDYVRAVGEKGRKMAEKGQCRQQRALAKESAKVWPEADEAVMATPCKEAAAGGGGGTPSGGGGTPSGGGGTPSGGGGTPSGGGGTPSGGGGTPSGGGSGGASFDQLHDEARAAFRNDQFGRALNRCEMALALRPGDQGATLTCAFAACRMKERAKAKKYMRALSSEARQDMVRQACMKAGVTDL